MRESQLTPSTAVRRATLPADGGRSGEPLEDTSPTRDGTAFTTRWGASHIYFGVGVVSALGEIVQALEPDGSIGFIASHSQIKNRCAERIRNLLRYRTVLISDSAILHTPDDVVTKTIAELQTTQIVIALGGGSAIGMGKAVCAALGAQLVAIPTTYSGSELTPLYGILRNGVKQVTVDRRALPAAVLYDPDLTSSLPARAAYASLMNCLGHCFDVVWATETNPLAQWAAETSAAFIGCGSAIDREISMGASELLLGGLYGGVALAAGHTCLHHALTHAIGGHTQASHGIINAIVLPAVIEYNEATVPEAVEKIAYPLRRLVCSEGLQPSQVVRTLAQQWGLPQSLSAVGIGNDDIPRIVELTAANPNLRYNPREIDIGSLTELVGRLVRSGDPA